ncbi:MAG: anaerobic ribonucleoside-triphosphate reductase activating protein [Lachnospiraceae bacterium]
MKIAGFLPTTLLDYPGKLACTIFTAGCNFRCPFCQNAFLALQESELNENAILSYREWKNAQEKEPLTEYSILKFLEKRRKILEGVCISGGEPTLQSDLPEFLCQIKNMGLLIKLDTNGFRPDVIKQLWEGHLIDYVAMDIKSSLSNYPLLCGIPGMNTDPIRESVALLSAMRIPHEFRTTLVKGLHSLTDMKEIGNWLPSDSAYYLQSFTAGDTILQTMVNKAEIDLQTAQNDIRHRLAEAPIIMTSFTTEELQAFLSTAQKRIPSTSLRGIS